jgi:uncharacterized delta-60 repeat protein
MRRPTGHPRRTTLWAAALGSAALACGAVAALAVPGAPDRAFGDGGRQVLVQPGADRAGAVALAPDGAIVVAGDGGPDTALIVTRLLADGTPDASFGDGGTRRVDLGGVETGDAVAVAPDGSVVVAGATTMGGNAVVLRLTPSGAPDPSFGPGGVRVFDFGGADAAHAVAIQPDGRIVVAGTGAAGRAILVTRLFPDGTPDPSFDGDGTAGIDLAPGEDVAFAIAVQPDGRIVTAGATGSPSNAVFVRMARTGAIDRTFGLAGVRVVDAGGADVVRALALRPDGRIVAAGVGGPRREAAVWRLDADGSLDGSFGRRGAAGFAAGDRTSSADAVALQPNGKVVVAGAIGRDMLVGRFQPGGATDLTWGRDGRRVVQLGGRDAGSAVAVQRDGAIVAAGQTSAGDGDVAVVRLDGDPPRPAPLCRSREATIVGTPGDDVLVGTPRRDVIVALAGDDRVQARGGGDIVCGGAGRDRLFGGPGDDVLLGQAGPDVMDGGDDADLLRGGGARDVCTGGPGRDAYACERITGR